MVIGFAPNFGEVTIGTTKADCGGFSPFYTSYLETLALNTCV